MTMRQAPLITDEQRAVMDEYSRNLGAALAANLNRPEPEPAAK